MWMFQKMPTSERLSVHRLMVCGHSSNATVSGEPACVLCRTTKLSEIQPDLGKRRAICMDCKLIVSSSIDLPFFKYCKRMKFDEYHCGCVKWVS